MRILISAFAGRTYHIVGSITGYGNCPGKATKRFFINLASFVSDMGNSAEPDQTPYNAASDEGLQCLLT